MSRTGEIRPALETLRDLRQGACLDDLAYAINQVVEAVVHHGGKGEVTLKLKIAPASKGEGNAMVVTDQIVTKTPDKNTAATIFFADDDHNLQRNNPRQPSLELRPVQAPAADLKEHVS